ncbi:MAG TPA: trimethylamine methyltransferase family protein [Thermoplasmata archaeon]|jgi:trimethylamine--corrinoid protein Co-methyltransferase
MADFAQRFKIRPPTSRMSENEKRMIHEAALDVMETVGVRVHSENARAKLKGAGAIVTKGSPDVKFPRDVVKSLVSKAPDKIVLAGRTKEFDLPLDGTHSYYTTDGCGIAVWDSKSGIRRKPVLEDIRRTAVIGDWLPYVSIYEPMVVASDLPEHVHVVSSMKVSMENTQKHILTESTTTVEEARAQVRMAAEIMGGPEELRKRHYISAMLCTMSPLMLDGTAVDAAMVWAENHVPIHITGMAQAGVSGPASIAGDLVVNHAETLAVICIMEAHAPGAPVMYGSVLTSMDPKTGSYMGGSPESTVLCGASVEMARFCNLPNSTGGFGSGAKIPGVQASLENAISAMSCAASGGEVVNGFGVPDGSTLLSYEQLLLDHEIASMVLKVHGGFDVNKETLAVDLVKKVGIGGSYLAQVHTMKYLRNLFAPMLWDSDPFDMWVRKGRKDPMQAAREKTDWIIGNHAPVPLEPSVSKGLDAIVKDFART